MQSENGKAGSAVRKKNRAKNGLGGLKTYNHATGLAAILKRARCEENRARTSLRAATTGNAACKHSFYHRHTKLEHFCGCGGPTQLKTRWALIENPQPHTLACRCCFSSLRSKPDPSPILKYTSINLFTHLSCTDVLKKREILGQLVPVRGRSVRGRSLLSLWSDYRFSFSWLLQELRQALSHKLARDQAQASALPSMKAAPHGLRAPNSPACMLFRSRSCSSTLASVSSSVCR